MKYHLLNIIIVNCTHLNAILFVNQNILLEEIQQFCQNAHRSAPVTLSRIGHTYKKRVVSVVVRQCLF